MNPKKEALISHQIAVHALLIAEAIDKVGATEPQANEFRNKCMELLPFCETILSEVYDVNQIYSSTYLTDLANKVETVIRKNFQQITG